ncbi:hypothetical protein BCR34DRAFT_558468 [Clohesyomyces aquaticus]|uniref:DRBM domain-containing protein n=1 Tax=Clohesyomyces aquaticus TaxID=1231657 RepID=A0A1Y1ZZS3_9PLEO|nr:hypothetical protein BCR34DRAFT_558468 [Clohesyomyces aquaticus]
MYHEYSLGTRFSCTCTLENMPDQIFGSPNEPLFASKKAARYHAAKCAIDFVKSQGLWPDNVTDLGGIKKKKVGQPPTTPNKNTETPNPNPNLPFPGSSVSYTSQVQALAHTLGLNTPEWRFAPEDPQAPGFHTVSAYFKSGGPHEGPVGEVRHIFGKKKAKEECARLTLEYLREVHRQRLALMGVDDAHDDTESSDDFESAPES